MSWNKDKNCYGDLPLRPGVSVEAQRSKENYFFMRGEGSFAPGRGCYKEIRGGKETHREDK